jgi:hypothetical protein
VIDELHEHHSCMKTLNRAACGELPLIDQMIISLDIKG